MKTRACSIAGAIFLTMASGEVLAQTNYCKVVPVRANALDFPSKHAWDLFLSMMHPAKDIAVARGEPDCTKPIGAPNTTSVWETFRLARTEVFLDDGSEPPVWGDTSLYFGHLGKVPEEQTTSAHDRPAGATIHIDEETNESVFNSRGGIGETRMNRSTYEFIRENCLYSFDGLSRYSKAVIERRKPPIVFPIDSIEVKAVWIKFTEKDVATNRHRDYYVATLENITYGLASFHILTKDTPNWFWATFHHVNSPENKFELPDAYGRPKDLDGTIWEHYVLGGTQTDFITPTGDPIVLSDARIEFEFEESSCITCHANAKGHPEPARTPDGKLKRDPKTGGIEASFEGPVQTTAVGIPDGEKFKKDEKPYFVQTDFLWSIPFRAQEEQAPPPARCNF